MITVDEEQVKMLSTRTDESFLKDVSQLPSSQNMQNLGNVKFLIFWTATNCIMNILMFEHRGSFIV